MVGAPTMSAPRSRTIGAYCPCWSVLPRGLLDVEGQLLARGVVARHEAHELVAAGLEVGHDGLACAGRELLVTANSQVVRALVADGRADVGADGLRAADPILEAATPRAAMAEARRLRAPVLLSRHVLAQTDFAVVEVEGLAFPRSYVLATPSYGEPTGEVRELVDRIRDHIRIWLR